MVNQIDWQKTIIPKVSELLESYSYRPTLRQVFYRLVSDLLISNTELSYKSLSRACVVARERRVIDPLAFEDKLRKYEGGDFGWGSAKDFIEYQLERLEEADQDYTRPL